MQRDIAFFSDVKYAKQYELNKYMCSSKVGATEACMHVCNKF